jgi:hypothetical protein
LLAGAAADDSFDSECNMNKMSKEREKRKQILLKIDVKRKKYGHTFWSSVFYCRSPPFEKG